MMNWKKQSWKNLRDYFRIFLEGLKKTTWKAAMIWTQNLQNTKHKCNHSTSKSENIWNVSYNTLPSHHPNARTTHDWKKYVNGECGFCDHVVETSSGHMEVIWVPVLVPCIHMSLNLQAENKIKKCLTIHSFTTGHKEVVTCQKFLLSFYLFHMSEPSHFFLIVKLHPHLNNFKEQ